MVKIYNDLSDVGNHENHIKKIGIFTNMVSSYRVTFVSWGGATVESSDGVIPLETGMLLGANALVLTNHSNVEITDSIEEIDNVALLKEVIAWLLRKSFKWSKMQLKKHATISKSSMD